MMPSTKAAPTPIKTFFQVFMTKSSRPSCRAGRHVSRRL
jgi:hypothetical protein